MQKNQIWQSMTTKMLKMLLKYNNLQGTSLHRTSILVSGCNLNAHSGAVV